MESKLIAIYPILHRCHQYNIGDELPADDWEMVQAWLKAKTAKWQEEELNDIEANQKKEEQPQVTAVPETAIAGMEGISTTGDYGGMVGRVPETPEREKPKVGRPSTQKQTTKPAAKKK